MSGIRKVKVETLQEPRLDLMRPGLVGQQSMEKRSLSLFKNKKKFVHVTHDQGSNPSPCRGSAAGDGGGGGGGGGVLATGPPGSQASEVGTAGSPVGWMWKAGLGAETGLLQFGLKRLRARWRFYRPRQQGRRAREGGGGSFSVVTEHSSS